MKKFYALLFLLLAGSLFSQAPTITLADMPTVGTYWVDMRDTSLSSFLITAPSASAQTWNYTSAFGTTYPVPTNLISPAGLQGSSVFSSANLGGANPDSSNDFYFINASGLYLDGTYDYKAMGAGAIDFSPNLQFVPTPITYNSSVPVNNSKADVIISGPGYTIDYVLHYKSTFTIDAFGSLQTPSAFYPNTIRLKTFRQIWDTSYVTVPPSPPFINSTGTDTTTTYLWLRNSSAGMLILMTAAFDKAGVIQDASYLDASSGINELNANGLNLFPNPTTGRVHIKLPSAEKAVVSVYDFSGKKIAEAASNGTDVITLSLAEMNSGFYFYTVSTPTYRKTGRLIKE
jgi:hypothetical protein